MACADPSECLRVSPWRRGIMLLESTLASFLPCASHWSQTTMYHAITPQPTFPSISLQSRVPTRFPGHLSFPYTSRFSQVRTFISAIATIQTSDSKSPSFSHGCTSQSSTPMILCFNMSLPRPLFSPLSLGIRM